MLVTSIDGSATWRFQGSPFLYPGNTTERPPEVVLGAQPCDFGNFYANRINDCAPCAAGLFSASGYDMDAVTECVQCAAGLAQANAGSSSCIECPAGYHQPYPGAKDCLACEVGTFAQFAAARTCAACQAGQYQSAPNASSCVACRPGFYEDRERSRACRSCQPGLYAEDPGRAACDACPSASKNFDIDYLVATLGGATPMLGVNVILNASSACLCQRGHYKVDCGASNRSVDGRCCGSGDGLSAGAHCCMPCPGGGVCLGGEIMPFAAPGAAKAAVSVTYACRVPCQDGLVHVRAGYWGMEHVRTSFLSCPLSAGGCAGGNATRATLCAPEYSGLGCSYCGPDYLWVYSVRRTIAVCRLPP